MGKSSFKDSLKALEADIQHANTLALDYPKEKDGARLQMRLSYSSAAQFFLFIVQWTDCQLAGVLGLLRILIYMTYADGETTMSVYERKASIREFYAVIFPSLLQLQRGITDLKDRKQKEVCTMKYGRKDEFERGKLSEIDLEREEELCCSDSSFSWKYPFSTSVSDTYSDMGMTLRSFKLMEKLTKIEQYLCRTHTRIRHLYPNPSNIEEECGICMEMNNMVVLPNCSHSLCLKCYQDWHGRSQSCPFCRDSLKRVNSGDLWIYTEKSDIVDLSSILREDCKRLFMYIDKLPLLVPEPVFVPYDVHVR